MKSRTRSRSCQKRTLSAAGSSAPLFAMLEHSVRSSYRFAAGIPCAAFRTAQQRADETEVECTGDQGHQAEDDQDDACIPGESSVTPADDTETDDKRAMRLEAVFMNWAKPVWAKDQPSSLQPP